MNRAERRRKQKAEMKKQPVYNYTPEQLKGLISEQVLDKKKEIAETVVDKVLNDYITLTLSVLYDKFDFTREDLVKFKNHLDSLSDCVTQETVSLNDMRLLLFDELEINLFTLDERNEGESIIKANKYKQEIFNTGVKATFLSFVENLNKFFNFGKKRAVFSSQCALKSMTDYFKDPKLFEEDYKQAKENIKLKVAFEELENFLSDCERSVLSEVEKDTLER